LRNGDAVGFNMKHYTTEKKKKREKVKKKGKEKDQWRSLLR
jgi:hypothetical protein